MAYKLNGKPISDGAISNRLAARKTQRARAKKRAKKDQWQGSIAQELVDASQGGRPVSSKVFHGGFPSFTPKKLNNMDQSDA